MCGRPAPVRRRAILLPGTAKFDQKDFQREARFVLTDHIDRASAGAVYDKLDDGSFVGRVPAGPGTVAFGSTLRQCEDELRSVLEDWILLGLKLGHPLPVIGGIDLTKEPSVGPVDAP